MSNRTTRSPSIPIPTSSAAARNIENVISMPSFLTSPATTRPRLSTIPRSQIHNSPERVLPSSSPRTISTAPSRTIIGSYSSVASRPSAGQPTNQSQSTFEPRIIRAVPSPARASDPACFPASTSPSAPRTRRPSAPRHPSATSALLASGVRPSALSAQLQSASMLSPPQAFPRPAYLDQSALRDLLVTDSPAPAGVARQADHPQQPQSTTQGSNATSTPGVLSHHPYIRQSTPSVDDGSDRESTTSPPPQSAPSAQTIGPMPTYMTNTVFRLPTRWSEMDRHPSLQVSPDGRDLTFCGPPCAGDKDAAAARANYPVPPACGIYYYEVQILQKGNKGHISIGFSAGNVRLSRLPGWEKQSWGYHADDGWSFPGHKDGNPYGPTFDTGDIVGCGIDFSQHRAFYTKNGSLLGMVFDNVGKGHEIYPSIGLRHTNEEIRVNFGHAPFKFAIEDHVLSQRNAVWGKIQETKINWDLLRGGSNYDTANNRSVEMEEKATAVPSSVGGIAGSVETADENTEDKSPMRNLVMSYLAHHGYVKTVKAFQAQHEGPAAASSSSVVKEDGMEMDESPMRASSSSARYAYPEAEQDNGLLRRVEIVNAVGKGDIDTAIEQTERHFPEVLKREEGLILFKLRCRKFVELILEASEALKRVKPEPVRERGRRELGKERYVGAADGMDGSGAMDVDDPSFEARTQTSEPTTLSSTPTPDAASESNITVLPISRNPIRVSRSTSSSSSTSTSVSGASSPSAIAKTALEKALAYGQGLEADYKGDIRPDVKSHLKRTFGVVAYTDPLAAGGEVAEMAGQEARMRLATELNQAILESQGKPPHPALEMVYRQTAACIVQLGLLNCGSAAFADMSKEFLEG